MELSDETSRGSNRSLAVRPESTMEVFCRICLSTRQHMISIHSTVHEYDQKTLLAMLLTICLPLNERDTVPGLPEQICRNCKWKLLSAYDLYETTLASDEQLRAQTVTVEGVQDNELILQKVIVGDEQMPEKLATGLKRSLNKEDQGSRPGLQEPKKFSLACVKEETPDESYGELYSLGKIIKMSNALENSTATTRGSVMGSMEESKAEEPTAVDESDDGPVQDPLEAFFEMHHQFETLTGNHVCGLCKQDFPYKSQCRMHIVQKHNPTKPFKCDICFCTLTSHHRLVRHQIVAHGAGQIKHEDVIKSPHDRTGEMTYTCPICQKVFSSSVRFKRHKNVHVVHNRPFKCEVCLYRFATKSQLTQHTKMHESKSPSEGSPGPENADGWYGCDRCDQMFPGKRARTMHLKKVHHVYRLAGGGQQPDDRNKNDYSCIICKATFARETVLNTHMKMHELLSAEKEKEMRLDLERIVKQELQQQMLLNVPPLPPLSPEVVDRSNHVLEPFVLGLVPVAKAGDGTGANNNNSATSVNNNSGSQSEGVGKSDGGGGGTSAATQKPKELPISDISYVCTICEKEFDERELLKKHQKKHPKLNVDIVSSEMGSGSSGSGSRGSISSPIKTFLPRLTARPGFNIRVGNGSLKQASKVPAGVDSSFAEDIDDDPEVQNDSHITETADDDGSASGKSPSFKCSLCNKMFSYNCYLTMHMRKNHDKSKPYGCKVCHYRFGYHGTLLRHQLTHSSQNVRPGGHGSIIFKCRICSAKFLELKLLNIHLKNHRKSSDDPDRKVQLIRCHECSQIFSDHAQFRQHMEKEHEDEMSRLEMDPSPEIQEQRLLVGCSSSLRYADRDSSSPLANLKLHSESRDEEDESFLNDLSIIKIEPNFD